MKQTYPHRELLIIADGADVRDLVPTGQMSIRILHIQEGLEIGGKRNYGCEYSVGDIIAVWDDDDQSAPTRLADQVARLQSTGKAVTGYSAIRFSSGNAFYRFQYFGSMQNALGTSLCFRRDWWQRQNFPEINVGEDNVFVSRARAAGELVVVDGTDMICAAIHRGNTSPKSPEGREWSPIDRPEWMEA